MSGFGPGVLFMIMGVRPGTENKLATWHSEEHMSERLGVPGFRRGRRGVARDVPADRRFLVVYEAETPEVFASAPYLARLNDPTPWTRAVSAECFAGLGRTVCRVRAGRGIGLCGWSGATILTGFQQQEGAEEIERALEVRGVVGAYLLEGTEIGQQQTAERAAREARGEADQSFPAVLFVEGIDEEPVRRATEGAAARLSAESAAVYRIQHVLTSDEVVQPWSAMA